MRGYPAIAELADIVEQFRPITPGISTTWRHVLFIAARDQELPRFYWSPLYNAAMGYHYAWLDDCFCVLKRKWVVANPVCDLMLAPIHREGDHAREQRLVERLLKAGVGVRVCEADGYGGVEWQHYEYIYEGGAPGRRGRNMIRRGGEANLRMVRAEGPTRPLIAAWADQTGGPRRTVGAVVDAAQEWPCDRFELVGGGTWGLTITEHLVGNHYAIVARVNRRDCPVPDPGLILHEWDRRWCNEGALLTIGADVSPHRRGAVPYKQRLGPVAYNRIGKLRARKISADEWRGARPGGTPTQTELRLEV